jgi:excinuclease ABC subunit C
MLVHSIAFDPSSPQTALAQIPQRPGVFALFGAEERAEPYLSRTPNLYRRLTRFLDARPSQSKRLRLTEKIARIEYTLTGSEFESLLTLYAATRKIFGEATRKRMHLRSPSFLRMSTENDYPRVYVAGKITKSAADSLFGPFPSRAAAEKFCDEMLNLFLLRRCHEDLHPDPAFPGCIYSEMKMCLAPCYKGCSEERYAEEAAEVRAFLETRGDSLIKKLESKRDAASAELDFEQASQLHAKLQKVQAVAGLASPAVHQLSRLSALVLQPAAEEDSVAVFLLSQGMLAGPAFYSVQGMRLHNEQSGSTSLFVHPVAVQAVPLSGDSGTGPAVQTVSRDILDERLDHALADLHLKATAKATSQIISDHLCLFSRWFYRAQAHRIGEVFFANEDGSFPRKQILRAISRVYSAAHLA